MIINLDSAQSLADGIARRQALGETAEACAGGTIGG